MNTRLLTISAAVLSFCACGPQAQISGGKQGASEALFAASQPLKGGADKMGSKIDLSASIESKCPQGGSVSLHGFGVALGGNGLVDVSQTFTADYNNCGVMTSSGVAGLTGSLKVGQAVKVEAGSVGVDQTIKGKLSWSGAVNDFLDIDVSQKVAVEALSQTSGGVSMVVKGTVIDTEGTYTFDESVSVTPGKITVTVTNEKK